ncbi:MAG TPA: bifunctional diaminohydroxyphosphoribosylaminopyrimidine deaminase/5-amino-6-(5-phosphoribosylamino)uracil reductase RibD [Hyphomicrobiaceae bacterium]|nr:bifunctional diaminohydroxyphosphoribosylaminopyrimidine deaminase/5-amino-6-(5-phosphoribosylamino)uracil reductase RibD [Hyphomicrobiaceae bacterium]
MAVEQPGAARAHDDQRFMRIALGLAKRMLGQTAPNPAVGAVIVDEATGEVVARGWTQKGGRPHAEVHALQRAGARARGKTMYVTLEPCSHHGQTPPCAEAILAAGVRRVVCAIEDPDARVSGKGIALMRSAGVAVDLGIEANAACWMAAGHILRMTERRPFVQLKMALSGDGLIAPGDGQPVWVTGPQVRNFAHLLRARADAILVGRGTVADDDPQLTCRLPGLAARSPQRIVLDPAFKTSRTSKLVRSAADVPVIIFGAEGLPAPAFPAGVSTDHVRAGPNGRLDLHDLVGKLAARGLTRIMVEGGPSVARAFLDADLLDEVVIARGTMELGKKGRKPLLDAGVELFADGGRWQAAGERRMGGDRLVCYRRRNRFAGTSTP